MKIAPECSISKTTIIVTEMTSTYLGQAPSIFGLGAIENACYMYIKMKLFSNRLTGTVQPKRNAQAI